MTHALSLSLQAWTPANAALHRAVGANDVRAARAALAAGADIAAEADVGPFHEPMTALTRVLIGTVPDPQWEGLRHVNVLLLRAVLDAAPAHWTQGLDAKEAMRSMTGHAVTNRLPVWDELIAHGLTPTADHLLDAVFPVSGAFHEPPRVVRGLHARLSPLPVWDHLWPHLTAHERQRALGMDPFTVLFRGVMGDTELVQAKWWLQQGATLGEPLDRLVTLAPSLEDRPAHQEAVATLVRYEASLVDQRLSQLMRVLQARAIERDAGVPLSSPVANTVNTLMNQLGQGWATYRPEVRDRLRAQAPLQWFTQENLHDMEQQWGCWLIEHGASLFTRYVDPRTHQSTYALQAMADDTLREQWECHETQHGETLLERPEWPTPAQELDATMQRLARDPSLPRRRRRQP